jgi:hypothetical protein
MSFEPASPQIAHAVFSKRLATAHQVQHCAGDMPLRLMSGNAKLLRELLESATCAAGEIDFPRHRVHIVQQCCELAEPLFVFLLLRRVSVALSSASSQLVELLERLGGRIELELQLRVVSVQLDCDTFRGLLDALIVVLSGGGMDILPEAREGFFDKRVRLVQWASRAPRPFSSTNKLLGCHTAPVTSVVPAIRRVRTRSFRLAGENVSAELLAVS